MNLTIFKESLLPIARNNKFKISFFFTDPIENIGDIVLDAHVQNFDLPDQTITMIPFKYLRESFPLPGTIEKQPFTVTFIEDEERKIRKFFNEWIDKIHSTSNFTNEMNCNNFSKNFILVYNKTNDGTESLIYRLKAVFPITVASLPFNRGEETLPTFNVTFNYHTLEYE